MPVKQNVEQVTRYAEIFSAMGTEPRRRIMRLLLSAYPNGLLADEISAELEIPSFTLLHHLEKLEHQKLVNLRHAEPLLWHFANKDAL